ncbi:MAG: sulfite exporter TauE/SafE family protein [Armatimonadetes bacterium]|nr:sulfite exporter TauE/SafE family protein [Armatimonadota bacterium]
MAPGMIALLSLLFFAAAVLYSAVGHAGASGYIAVMAFTAMPPALMKPTALVLNVLVATISTLAYVRAGFFSWRTFWPLAVGSVPLSFVGGALAIPGPIYRPVVGGILLLAAARLLRAQRPRGAAPKAPAIPVLPAIACGAGIGFLSGATGTGGGIFLSPLLLSLGWAETRETAGVSAAFILANSVAGLAGHLSSMRFLPGALPLWLLAAGLGGVVGTHLGSRVLPPETLRRCLAAVLLIAAAKLLLPQ